MLELAATVLVAVLALTGTITAARIARDGDRAIRARISKDVAVWKDLPPGSQPRKQMFDLIGRQVDALSSTANAGPSPWGNLFSGSIALTAASFMSAVLVPLLALTFVAPWLAQHGVAQGSTWWWVVAVVVILIEVVLVLLTAVATTNAMFAGIYPAVARAARRRVGR